MVYQPERHRLWQLRTNAPADIGNTRTMKAVLSKTNAAKEPKPPGGHVPHRAIRLESPLARSITFKLREQRDQFRRTGPGKRLLSLRFGEMNEFAVKINVAKQQVGVVEPAPGKVRNLKHHGHKLRPPLFQRLHNHRQMFRLYFWLFLGVIPWNADTFNRASAGPTHGDSVPHHHAQQLEFVEGCVFLGSPNAALAGLRAGPPYDVIPCRLAGQVFWEQDFTAAQERLQGSPAIRECLEVAGMGAVTQAQEFRHPFYEPLFIALDEFFVFVGLPEPVTSLAGLRGIIVTKAQRFGWLAGSLLEADMPVRRAFSLKEPRHGLLVAASSSGSGGFRSLQIVTDCFTLPFRVCLEESGGVSQGVAGSRINIGFSDFTASSIATQPVSLCPL